MSDSTRRRPEACRTLPASAGLLGGHLEIAVEDWDVMFRSVVERLRHAAGEGVEVAPELHAPGPATLLQIIVLECASALDQLHAALKHDRIRIE